MSGKLDKKRTGCKGHQSMGKEKSIKKNFMMNAILTMSSFIFPLLSFPYVSRILLPEGTGRVSFATSLISYFALFSQLGIPTYGVRACAIVRDDKEKLSQTVQELLLINLLMSAVVYAVLFAALAFVPRLREDRPLYLIVSLTILFNAIGMEWLYKALEQYTYITVRSVLFKIIALAAMFLFIHEKEDYVIYGALSILAASASSICNFLHVHKYVSLVPVGHYRLKRHLKAVVVFFAMSCAVTIYTHLDTVMLGIMKTDADVGYYNAAVKIKSVLVSVITSLGAVLLPRASYYIEHGLTDTFWHITKKAFHFTVLAALPFMMFFILFAEQGIYFLSGRAYYNAIRPMQIIMPTLLFIGITNVLGIQILVPLGKEKIVFYSEVAGAVTDLILNAVLIPRYASSGAAVGTLAAEFMVLAVQAGYLRKEALDMARAVPLAKILFACALSIAASVWVPIFVRRSFLTLAMAGSLFFGVYACALLLMRESFLIEMWEQVKGVVGKKKTF